MPRELVERSFARHANPADSQKTRPWALHGQCARTLVIKGMIEAIDDFSWREIPDAQYGKALVAKTANYSRALLSYAVPGNMRTLAESDIFQVSL